MKDAEAILAERVVGQPLTMVTYFEFDWIFTFGNDVCRLAANDWRILADGGIAFTHSDHGHKFGHPAPQNGEEIANRLLGHKIVERVSIRADTADLTITFEGGSALEALSHSSGYESWQVSGSGASIVALGGGGLAIYEAP